MTTSCLLVSESVDGVDSLTTVSWIPVTKGAQRESLSCVYLSPSIDAAIYGFVFTLVTLGSAAVSVDQYAFTL